MTSTQHRPALDMPTGRLAGSARRITALARAEVLLLLRNPIMLFVVAVMPVALVLLIRASVPPEMSGGTGIGASVVTSLTGATLILVVYYNLVTAVVSRREELVLKRLRTGELADGEILAGVVAPAVVIAWTQVAIGGVAASAIFGLPRPVAPLVAVVAVVAGTAVFVLLALATAGWTRTVHLAEITTTPVLVASLALSGLMLPVADLPGPLGQIAQLLPLTPVVSLLRVALEPGYAGGGSAAPAAVLGALLVLGVWFVLGLLLTHRFFRWEPRR